jgi:sugar/nucleoside kinase (ribokinase family)
MSLLVVGSIGFDTLETPFGKAENVLGGAAVYCGIGASFFSAVRVVGVVGEDFLQEHVAFLRAHKLDLDGLEVKPGKTFRWGATYGNDLNSRETLFTDLNVFASFNPRIPEKYRDTEYVFLGNIGPELQLGVLEQIKQPRLVALDTMNYWIERTSAELRKVLQRVDVLFVNDSEARALAEDSNLVSATQRIRKMGPKIIIIKKGEHGALMSTGNSFFSAPAFPLESVCDPTGAGDTFAGGFMGYLAKVDRLDEAAFRQAAICGSTMASFACERFGPERFETLNENEIHNRVNAFHEMTTFVPW